MQLYLVTNVIDGDTFEVSPDIPRNGVLQTSMQPLETPNMFKKVRLANIMHQKAVPIKVSKLCSI